MTGRRSRVREPPPLHRRVLPFFDALAEEPVWRRALIAYLFASAFLLWAAGLVNPEHGIASVASAPAAAAVPFAVAFYALASVVREILNTPMYFAAVAGVLLAVSRLTPGKGVTYRQLFSVTVHAGYVLLLGYALRIVLAVRGVELAGAAAVLLPDPAPLAATSDTVDVALNVAFGPPADMAAVGVFDTAFHALLGVAYFHIRNHKRVILGAVWGVGLSVLVDVVWLLVAGN